MRANLDRHGVELVRGEATLTGPGAVEVTGVDGGLRALEAEAILIVTGSRPFRPRGIPFDDP